MSTSESTIRCAALDQRGCVLAIARADELVHEKAFGLADLHADSILTPRHRFRIASLSKTFTATGVLKLVEQGRLHLGDTAGTFASGLHPAVAAASFEQLLSHSAGLSRDGSDAGYFADQRPFHSAATLRKELTFPPVLPAGARFKYSNYGYGLLGLIIERVTRARMRFRVAIACAPRFRRTVFGDA